MKLEVALDAQHQIRARIKRQGCACLKILSGLINREPKESAGNVDYGK